MTTDLATGYVDPAENPAVANAAIEAALRDDAPAPPQFPVIDAPSDGIVRLPAGLVVDDKVVREAEVQELTGAHEERLTKVRASGDAGRFLQALLVCGVASIGGKPATEEVLDQLLVGDREALLLGIREATYGADIEIGQTVCETCGETYDIVVKASDVPVKMLSGDRQFEVPLRKGGKAIVRLPNGADQTAYLSEGSATDAERNSLLLARCVLAITDKSGETQGVAGFPSLVRDGLGILDRQSILQAINERQPGPQYNEVEYTHECGQKMPVVVGLMHLFPGL